MKNISWLPEDMDGGMAGRKVCGKSRKRYPCSDGNTLNLECIHAKILVMVLFLQICKIRLLRETEERVRGIVLYYSLQLHDNI